MSIEDRVRTATEATAATVREIRPLTLPYDHPAHARRRWFSSLPVRRAWGGWLLPVAAATAVVAVAALLVAARNLPGPAAPGPGATAVAGGDRGTVAVPRYAAFINVGANKQASDLTVVDTRTGRPLATLNPPAHEAFYGVTGAADDRTFVVDVVPRPLPAPTASRSWYLLRVNPGSADPVSLTPLPIQGPSSWAGILGLALSPDGRTLAVLYGATPDGSPPTNNGPQQASELRTYSVATGKALRTWKGPGPQPVHGVFTMYDHEDNVDGLSWLANGKDLAFTYPGQAIRLLDTTRPGTNLMTSSRPVFTLPQTGAPCLQALLTPDGRTVLCASKVQNLKTQTAALGFAAYSVATGKLERVLYRYTGKVDTGDAQLVWVGSATTAVVLLQYLHYDPATQQLTNVRITGVLTPGKLTPLRFPTVPRDNGIGLIAF